MTPRLTPESFAALAELLRLRSGASSLAASLVFVEGVRPADAARAAGCLPQTLNHTIQAVRRGVDLAEKVAAGTTRES